MHDNVNSKNIQVRVAWVTGSARRIGMAIARQLHAAGFAVVLHAHRSTAEAMGVLAELNQLRANSAYFVSADLGQLNDLPAVFAEVMAWRGRLDVLVNNASVFLRTPVAGLCTDEADRMWLINVKAPFCLSELAYPELARVQGCIINLTDIHAEKPLTGYGWYCQSKAALKMQTEWLAREYAPHVRVNAVAPGAIIWPEGANALTRAQQQAIVQQTPLQCHGAPVRIAEAVLSLLDNAFITGQTLRVDGGRSLL